MASFTEDKWLGTGNPAGHLFDALAWMLRAAQEWRTQKELQLGVGGYHIDVFSMDSTFLRARLLFEFLTGTGKNYCHAECLFGLSSQLARPSWYSTWVDQLHVGAIHLQDRENGGPLTEYGGAALKDLNEMPVDIARGVLQIWKDFEKELSVHNASAHVKAVACRQKAEEDSRSVVTEIVGREGAYNKKASDMAGLTILF
jgi:hypothetical protein